MLIALPRRAATMLATVSVLAAAVLAVPATADARTGAATGCPRPAAGILRSAPGGGKTVAITFDDGPSTFTPQILAILRRYDVRATFFETGAHAAAHPALTREVAAEGQLLADHTYDHFYPGQVSGGWSRSYLSSQFSRTNALLRELSGHQPCFFRPPGGFQTAGMTDVARAQGMSTVLWSVDTEDWKQPAHTSAAATALIVARAEAGVHQSHPLVLMHEGKASHEPESQVSSNRSNDIKALPAILSFYRSHGYRFVDLLGRSALPPAPTTLALTSSPTRVRGAAGAKVIAVAGRLQFINGPVAHKVVRWFSRPVGTTAWHRRGRVSTNARGYARVVDRPRVSTEYTLRFGGAPGLRPSEAAGVRIVKTYTIPTELSVTGPASVPAGTDVTLTGAVASGGHARAGVKVIITLTRDGQAPVTRTARTDAKGRYTFTDALVAVTTAYTVRVEKALPYRWAKQSLTVEAIPVDPPPPAPADPAPVVP